MRAQIASTMLNKYKPMLVPPRPWRSASRGGHLTLATPVVRLAAGSREQLHSLHAADAEMFDDRGDGASVVRSPALRDHDQAQTCSRNLHAKPQDKDLTYNVPFCNVPALYGHSCTEPWQTVVLL